MSSRPSIRSISSSGSRNVDGQQDHDPAGALQRRDVGVGHQVRGLIPERPPRTLAHGADADHGLGAHLLDGALIPLPLPVANGLAPGRQLPLARDPVVVTERRADRGPEWTILVERAQGTLERSRERWQV